MVHRVGLDHHRQVHIPTSQALAPAEYSHFRGFGRRCATISGTTPAGDNGGRYVHTTGYPTTAISERGTLSKGVHLTDNHNGTAALAGTPASNSAELHRVTLKAASTSGSAKQSYVPTVKRFFENERGFVKSAPGGVHALISHASMQREGRLCRRVQGINRLPAAADPPFCAEAPTRR
jgi:hypothetical protein